ncbi:hypothetical protein [Actinomyces israelii]
MDPGPIRDMLRAPDSRSGDEAYWRIEGTAFYSHELEEASEPLTQILVDAVCDGDGTPLGLMFATDMLVEITCGYTSPHEEEAGSAGLADRCRAIVRHRLPCLYRLVDDTTDDIVLSHLIWIVGQVEDDTTARRAFLEKVSHRELGKPSRNALHWCLVEEYGQDHQKGDQGPEHSEPH